MFSRFFEGIKQNDLITSSPSESINAEIKKFRTEVSLKLFNHLEVIGFNRCLDLYNLTTDMTPYFTKRKAHIEDKATKLHILKKESHGTSRVVVDPRYKINSLRWEVKTRNLNCVCGKYSDRVFPCSHMVKAFNDLNETYEHLIHPCYFTKTIKEALRNLISPVSLAGLRKDEALISPVSLAGLRKDERNFLKPA